jgi:hypothetical protein
MPTQYGKCWSCQTALRQRTAVWLDDERSLPCCRRCWGKIPEGERLRLAQMFHDRTDKGLGIAETLSALRDLMHSSLGDYFQRRTDEDPGRMN